MAPYHALELRFEFISKLQHRTEHRVQEKWRTHIGRSVILNFHMLRDSWQIDMSMADSTKCDLFEFIGRYSCHVLCKVKHEKGLFYTIKKIPCNGTRIVYLRIVYIYVLSKRYVTSYCPYGLGFCEIRTRTFKLSLKYLICNISLPTRQLLRKAKTSKGWQCAKNFTPPKTSSFNKLPRFRDDFKLYFYSLLMVRQ